MSRQPTNRDDLDFGCTCPYHSPDQYCAACRPDLCNPNNPIGTGLCSSASNPNSANLTPVAAPHNTFGGYRTGDTGRYFMSGANYDPSAASTSSSGQGPSNPQPIQQQPGRNADMQYPSPGYGTMGAGYGGLAQSPASYGSGGQEFYGSVDANVSGTGYYNAGQGADYGSGGSSQQAYVEEPSKSNRKGKGKAKNH